MRSFTKNFVYLFCLLGLFACNPASRLEKGQYLLKRNNLRIDNRQVPRSELASFIQQQPSSSVLRTFYVKAWFYELADRGKPGGFKNWVKKNLGEKPVLLDTSLANNTLGQMKLYMNGKGYFNAEVSKTIDYNNQKASVTYRIVSHQPYMIRKIDLLVQDPSLLSFVLSQQQNTLLKPKDNFDVAMLDEERNRIAGILKNRGYYEFSKEYIYYRIDSALGNHQVDIQMIIKNVGIQDTANATETGRNHSRFRVNRIFITPDFNPLQRDTAKNDTMVFSSGREAGKETAAAYYFVTSGKLNISPRILSRAVFIKSGSYYRAEEVSQTYNSLSNLKFFRFINIFFTEAAADTGRADGEKWLDCHIQLTRSPVQSFAIETEGTNSSGNLGIAGNLVYQNKNTFRGLEIFNLKLKGAMEMQKIYGGTESADIPIFNTFETGAEGRLEVPKFLVPLRQELFPQDFRPKTTLITGINYQRRQAYRRYILNLSFGYEWQQSARKAHFLYPMEINSVKVFLDSSSSFYQTLQLYDKKFRDQYTNHLNIGMKYSFIYNTQQINKNLDFIYFRANFESAGLLMNLYDQSIRAVRTSEGKYTLFNIPYAQFVKADGDIRYYRVLNEKNSMIFRLAAGLGLPYSNSDALPFEKAFYAGGANGLRGWEIRSLGPGGYHDTTGTNFDKVGDIHLEANTEYRFPIYKSFKGALFLDAGNIWMLRSNAQFPEGTFEFSTFSDQIALDAGLGFRFDFSFFIFRIDAAMPVRDPSMPVYHRWITAPGVRIRDVVWNFGIGYPF